MDEHVPKRIALLTQWFPPEPPGPELWVAQQLEARGLKPIVVTGVPNYPSGTVAEGYSPWRACLDKQEGFTVQRCPLYPSHGASALRRFATYGSFAASSTLIGRRILSSADVTLAYCSPATANSAALVANAVYGTPYVLWIQDLWPDTVFATGFFQSGIKRRFVETSLNAFTRRLYARAAHIAVITPGMRQLLVQRGVAPERISVVYNWAEESVMRPVSDTGQLRSQLGIPADHLVLMYAGGHGLAQRLSAWVDAVSMVTDLPDLSFVFVGDGTEKAALVDQAKGMRNIHFLPRVDRRQATAWIAESDIQVISLADDPLFDLTLPSKTQSSLACGKAIIASVRGDLARILSETGAGWSARPEDAASIANCIRLAHAEGKQSLATRGAVGRDYYLGHMSAEMGGDAMAEILRHAARKR